MVDAGLYDVDFIVDIDTSDPIEDAKTLYNSLIDRFELLSNQLLIYYTGSAGFHTYVPHAVFKDENGQFPMM